MNNPQPPYLMDKECDNKHDKCQNIKCVYEGWGGERYRCDVCGYSYYLDYEDMK